MNDPTPMTRRELAEIATRLAATESIDYVADEDTAADVRHLLAEVDYRGRAIEALSERLTAKNAELDRTIRSIVVTVGGGVGTGSAAKDVPQGLCGDRRPHEAHRHESASLGTFQCHADPAKRLPFAMEPKRDNDVR